MVEWIKVSLALSLIVLASFILDEFETFTLLIADGIFFFAIFLGLDGAVEIINNSFRGFFDKFRQDLKVAREKYSGEQA